jgi:trk system potassium uptake protein TrkA
MRAIFVGASPLTVMTAQRLLKSKHDVVIIDTEEDKLSGLSEVLDCGLIHGDGSRPSVLEELSPSETDLLFCFSNDDQDNIIASLVGRTMQFSRVITKIEDPDYESICNKLGLDDTFVPDRDVGERLADLVEDHDVGDLGAAVKGGIRFFHFVARQEDAGKLAELALPGKARVIAITRDGESVIAGENDRLQEDDQVLVIAQRHELEKLRKRFYPDE